MISCILFDDTYRTGVLEQEGHLQPGILDKLGKENEVNIAKISWLSKKDSMKAYGSMVVYVTKRAMLRNCSPSSTFTSRVNQPPQEFSKHVPTFNNAITVKRWVTKPTRALNSKRVQSAPKRGTAIQPASPPS